MDNPETFRVVYVTIPENRVVIRAVCGNRISQIRRSNGPQTGTGFIAGKAGNRLQLLFFRRPSVPVFPDRKSGTNYSVEFCPVFRD